MTPLAALLAHLRPPPRPRPLLPRLRRRRQARHRRWQTLVSLILIWLVWFGLIRSNKLWLIKSS